MWGLYEININIPLLDNRKGFLGHFISGVLATVLATPCTAPFLGVAIGFAVTRGAFEIIIIFFAMGLGLALPYLLLSLFPGLITILPKPGKWMVTIKKTMGVLLAISAVWLIWVLEGQLGRVAAIILLLLCVIKVLKLWAADHFGLIRKIKIPLMVFIIFLSFIIPVKVSNNSDKPLQDAHAMWEDFYPEHIAGLVKNGKIVFVDVTANWCLTCKVNKFAVLERQEIQAEFLRLNVVAMQANWTNRDADIAKYLMENHRAGIPFNIVYGPGAPDGIILSELLTTNDVKEALKKAAGK
jgi:suppressor for copper-sensitivity B